MDSAYEGENMREKALEKGYSPIVPQKSNRKEPWEYDKDRYKQRNAIERYFLRLKRFRKIFTRYDKLDVLFCGFIYFAMIVDAIQCEQILVSFLRTASKSCLGVRLIDLVSFNVSFFTQNFPLQFIDLIFPQLPFISISGIDGLVFLRTCSKIKQFKSESENFEFEPETNDIIKITPFNIIK